MKVFFYINYSFYSTNLKQEFLRNLLKMCSNFENISHELLLFLLVNNKEFLKSGRFSPLKVFISDEKLGF